MANKRGDEARTYQELGSREYSAFTPGRMSIVSSASFWEMAIKKNLGRLTLPGNIIGLLEADSLVMLPITPIDAFSVADLPLIHQDPFDRMLITQAKLHNLVLITKNEMLLKYPLATIKA